tara:strand:- start:158 stop:337 length:180 start_codon:yes stop_codon:yes gene_type:complete
MESSKFSTRDTGEKRRPASSISPRQEKAGESEMTKELVNVFKVRGLEDWKSWVKDSKAY